MENSEEYHAAKKRAEARVGFYRHSAVYGAVILLLAIMDLATSPGAIWFYWPMLGWGVAVAIHAALVFVFPGGLAVTEQMIEKEMRKARARP